MSTKSISKEQLRKLRELRELTHITMIEKLKAERAKIELGNVIPESSDKSYTVNFLGFLNTP